MNNDLKKIVIIPTYNEKNNIGEIVEKIFDLNIPNLSILVVDDNSPDGTGQIAEELAQKFQQRLSVIHRSEKRGLGSAYVEGFRYALNNGADYIFEIDADLSHDPLCIPVFLKAIENYDLVLGSRYINDGAIKNWNIIRRILSWGGNLYAQLILNMPIKDLTGGFKCFRRSVLEKININSLTSLGYVFQIETTYRAWQAGFRIGEIPITFTERKEGESKFNIQIFFDAFIKVLKLRFNSESFDNKK